MSCNTYSGYEDAVREAVLQRIETMGMQDLVFDCIVPKESQIIVKNGEQKTEKKRIFPGYVLVEMTVTDDSWYVVRNTPNVSGFIGSGTTPTPIDAKEMASLQGRMKIEEPTHKIDMAINDSVKITDGPFKNFDGKISNVDDARGKVKVLVSMFGRETPVELDALQVKKT